MSADKRMLELVEAYLEGILSDPDRDELEARLKASAEDKALFHDLTGLEGLLAGRGVEPAPGLAESIMRHIRAEQGGRTKEQVMDKIRTKRSSQSRVWRIRWALFGAVASIVLVLGYFLSQSSPPPPEKEFLQASITDPRTGVMVHRDNQNLPALEAGKLIAGDEVFTEPGLRANIGYAGEDTRIELAENTRIALLDSAAGKLTRVRNGLITCLAAPQPAGRPWRLLTNQAEIEVLGTAFRLRVGPALTRLEVTEGQVMLTDTDKHAAVVIAAGQFTEAGPGLVPRIGELEAGAGLIAGISLSTDISPHLSTVDDIVEDVVEPAMTDKEKALALWRWALTHTFHFDGPQEPWQGEDLSGVKDANKLLHSYGFATSGGHAVLMMALWDAAGLRARGRQLGFREVTEVFYEKTWHYIDANLAGYAIKPDGSIASVDELIRPIGGNPDLLARPVPGDLHFPWLQGGGAGSAIYRDLAEWKQTRKPLGTGPNRFNSRAAAHPVNLSLSRGMTFTRHFRTGPQGRPVFWGTDNQPVMVSASAFLGFRDGEQALMRTDRGAEAAWGEFVWEPDLTIGLDEPHLMAAANILCGPGRPNLRAVGEGAEVVLNMQTPYVIAGAQSLHGVILTGQAQGRVQAEISVNNGLVWESLGEISGVFSLDLTRQAQGRYQYQLRLRFQKGGGLNQLRLITRVQHNPAMAPWLRAGENTITPAVSGLAVKHLAPDLWTERDIYLAARQSDENLRWQKDSRKHLAVRNVKQPAHAIFPVACPAPIRKLIVLGSFGHFIPARPGETFRLSVSTDSGNTWQEAGSLSPSAQDDSAWAYVDGQVDLKGDTRTCLVRAEIDPRGDKGAALCGLQIYALYEQPHSAELKLTYVWTDGKGPQTHTQTVDPADPQPYTITCGKNPRMEYVRFEIAE